MAIKFEEVTHVYGKNTPFEFYGLNNVNVEIKEGSFTAIIGHTGSGKSTLVQHLNALLLPTSGTVEVEDYVITAEKKPSSLKPLRKKVGLVFQFPEYQLFEESVLKDIIFGPTNFNMDIDEATQKAKEVIQLVGMDESYLEKSPFELSGGQKRRVAIAGILIMDPDILVLDEPTAGLDPQGAIEMMELFKKLHEMGKTVLIVTHDMNHVLNYCEEAIVMKHGRVEKHCSVEELFEEPEYLRSLSINLPTITEFIDDLNHLGFDLSLDIKDIDILASQIGGALNG